MPREPSDARAALMAVYLSQRPSFLSPSDMPTTSTKKLKPAERPPYRKKHAKDLAMTTMLKKNLKNLPHRRRRRDAEECLHPMRPSSSGLALALGPMGRTIYGVGEASGGVIRRQMRRNVNRPGMSTSPPSRTSQDGLRKAQLAVIKVGEEIAWREAEARRVQTQKEARKKGDGTCGQMKETGDDRILLGEVGRIDSEGVGAEDVAHADRYFDLYINAEAWVVN